MAVLLSIDRVAPLIAIVRRQGSPPLSHTGKSVAGAALDWWFEALATQALWALQMFSCTRIRHCLRGIRWCSLVLYKYCTAVLTLLC